jgi:aspartate racemase
MSVINHQAKPKLGIIGGMGPEATVLLMSRIIVLTDAKDDCDHIPMLVDNNTQVPSRIKAIIEKTGDDPSNTLITMAKKLEGNGAKMLAMPCNTAHYYASTIQEAVNIPLLNMIDLTAERLSLEGLTNATVGILGSPALALTEVYDNAFSSHGLQAIYPENQQNMLNAIRLIKENSESADARQLLQNEAQKLILRGSERLVIACSEFSLISDCLPSIYPVIDSIDVLAKAVVDFVNQGN